MAAGMVLLSIPEWMMKAADQHTKADHAATEDHRGRMERYCAAAASSSLASPWVFKLYELDKLI